MGLGICKKLLYAQKFPHDFDKPKCKLPYNSFIISNFKYSPLMWMFCGKTANNDINRVHKRALRSVSRDYNASFDELLVENEERIIHVRNLQMLIIEVYKSLNHKSPSFLWELSARKEITTPDVIKSSNTVFDFITNIKNWSAEVFNCNVCKKLCNIV